MLQRNLYIYEMLIYSVFHLIIIKYVLIPNSMDKLYIFITLGYGWQDNLSVDKEKLFSPHLHWLEEEMHQSIPDTESPPVQHQF